MFLSYNSSQSCCAFTLLLWGTLCYIVLYCYITCYNHKDMDTSIIIYQHVVGKRINMRLCEKDIFKRRLALISTGKLPEKRIDSNHKYIIMCVCVSVSVPFHQQRELLLWNLPVLLFYMIFYLYFLLNASFTKKNTDYIIFMALTMHVSFYFNINKKNYL